MNDIVERLRRDHWGDKTAIESADEIEKLRATVSRCMLNDPPGDCYAAEVVELRARLARAEKLIRDWWTCPPHLLDTAERDRQVSAFLADQPTGDRENV